MSGSKPEEGFTRRKFLLAAAVATGAAAATLLPKSSNLPDPEFTWKKTLGDKLYDVSGRVVQNSRQKEGFCDYPHNRDRERQDLEKKMGHINNQYRTVIEWRPATPTQDRYWPWIKSKEFSEFLFKNVSVGDRITVHYRDLFAEDPIRKRHIGYLVTQYWHPKAGSPLADNEHLF